MFENCARVLTRAGPRQRAVLAKAQALTMTAVSSDDEIIMFSDEANAQGRYSRITFFDITDNTFEWKLEWSSDQNLWVEVYRIHGTRRTDDSTTPQPVAEDVAAAASQQPPDDEDPEVDVYEPDVSEAEMPDSASELSESVESEMTDLDSDETDQ